MIETKVNKGEENVGKREEATENGQSNGNCKTILSECKVTPPL